MIIFIAIITVVIILMCSYFFLHHEKTNKSTLIKKEEKLEVKDSINYQLDNKSIACQSEKVKEVIRLPHLTTKKDGVRKINNQIDEDFKVLIAYTKQAEKNNLNNANAYSSNYDYLSDDNYIVIHINSKSGIYCSTIEEKNYYYTYDVVGDKYLTYSDLLSLYNVTMDSINQKLVEKGYNIQVDNSYYAYIKDDKLMVGIDGVSENLSFDK